jgi:quinol monooxygenase YgiN
MKIRLPWRLPSHSSITAVLTQYHVKASFQDKFLAILSGYIIDSLGSPGNIMASAYYEQGDACILWTIERWQNHAYYKNNQESATAKKIGALTKAELASPVEVIFMNDLEMLSKEPDHHAITVMLLVDVKNGTEALFRSLNHEVMATLQHEPGVLAFQFSQVVDHKTKFIVYKQFRSWDTFQYHLKDPALEPIMKFLQTSIKEPPFEKGYHHLIQFAPL